MTNRTRKTGTLLVLAVLLAAISTGSITICDALIFDVFDDAEPIVVSLKAGDTATQILTADDFLFRFGVCPSNALPQGAYFRYNRDALGAGTVSVDLVVERTTTPGHYPLLYAATAATIFQGGAVYQGTLDLTVLPPDESLVACFYAYGAGEVLLVNQPIGFYAYCSTQLETNPIVQYKWWFNYNGNPSSMPDATTTDSQVNHTYSTPGAKPVRLVIRAQNGDEAAKAQTITVNGL